MKASWTLAPSTCESRLARALVKFVLSSKRVKWKPRAFLYLISTLHLIVVRGRIYQETKESVVTSQIPPAQHLPRSSVCSLRLLHDNCFLILEIVVTPYCFYIYNHRRHSHILLLVFLWIVFRQRNNWSKFLRGSVKLLGQGGLIFFYRSERNQSFFYVFM